MTTRLDNLKKNLAEAQRDPEENKLYIEDLLEHIAMLEKSGEISTGFELTEGE